MLLALYVSVFILSSCDVKSPIYNTDHPGQGKVTLTTDWTDRGEGVDKPVAYIVELDGYCEEAKTDLHMLDKAFDPGNYTLYTYSNVEELSVSNGTATLRTVPAPDGASGTYVEPLSGWLLAATLPVSITADTKHAFTVSTHQHSRQLTFLIEPDEAVQDMVMGVTASLSGVAGAWDLAGNQSVGAPATVSISFTRITEGTHAGKWQGAVLLLGITGNSQQLTLTVTPPSGTLPFAVNSDLSTELAGFNADKKTPLSLSATIGMFEIGPGASGIITDWEKDSFVIDAE